MAQTLGKAMKVIEAVAAHQPVEVRRLAELLSMPLPTVYRFISSLEENGYVERLSGNAKYQLGLAFVRLGAIALRPFRLSDFVHPVLKDVAMRTGESVSFQIRRGTDAICLDYVESDHSIRLSMRVGQLTPLYAGSGPKVLLAHADEGERERIIRECMLKRIGPKTIRSKQRLRQRLNSIAQRGYDISQEELTENARGVAVPVFDSSSKVIAALTVSGPKYRMGRRQLLNTLAVLRDAARELSNKFPSEFMMAAG
ncbi:MAG: IclR family transcriptional regulator [Candidatus Binatia bacterium]